MATHIEREIKLRFDTAESARTAVAAAGATPLRARRLQDDYVFDWPDAGLREAHCLLRVRQEGGLSTITFKGPPQSGVMKVREEIETTAGDGMALRAMLERLGFHVRFRYQKYRQEFEYEGVILAVDETPIGTFVEIEGDETGIHRTATGMGRGPADYIVESYRELFLKTCESQGLSRPHMVFGSP